MAMSRTLSGTLLVAGATALWGLNGTISRVVMDTGLEPARLAELRIVSAAILLVLWLVWRDRRALRLHRREILPYLAFGSIGLICVQWAYFEAINEIPIGIALIIEYSAPLLVAVWVRVVWKRHLPLVVWLAVPVAMVGLAFVLGLGGGQLAAITLAGVLWSLAAALSYAYYALHAERLTRTRSPVAVLGIGMAMGAIVLSIALPWWTFPWSLLLDTAATAPLAAPAWVYCIYVIVLGTIVPFGMMLAGVQRVGADGATITAMLEPILAGAIAWVLLEQALTIVQVLGAVIVMAAVTTAQVVRARAAT